LPWRPDAGIAAFWFLIAVLPVSNLLFPVGIVLAERTLYLPSLSASIAAGLAAQALLAAGRARALALAAACALLLLGARTIIRNPDWEDTRAVQAALF